MGTPPGIRSPDEKWLSRFFHPTLLQSKAYAIHSPPNVAVKLDQNESPIDWPVSLKETILARLASQQWNRYPAPIGQQLTEAIATYADVKPHNILTGPGSNHLISMLFQAFGHSLPGDVVIARPSFGLFEMSCRYSGIPYTTWDLTANFEFDIHALNQVRPGSLIVFASPNNPTGTCLSIENCRKMLKEHSESMFIIDEAYFEFANEPLAPLLAEFSNAILLRTFSKTMGAAGVRLGYIVAAQAVIQQLEKLRLPYLLNHFSLQAGVSILADPDLKAFVADSIKSTVASRNLMELELRQLGEEFPVFSVIPSQANFVLLKGTQQSVCDQIYQGLIDEGILVRDVSGGPGLSGCLRVTVGLEKENAKFLSAMQKILGTLKSNNRT